MRARASLRRTGATLLLALAVACAGTPEAAPPPVPPAAPGAPASPLAAAPGLPATVLLVTVAGLTPDLYLADEPAMPGLAALGREGIAAEAVKPVAPPAVHPVHTTLVTGVPPRVHRVVADQLLGEHGVRATPFAHASHVRAPTLWQAVSAAGGEVAALDWPATLGANIPLLLPELPVRSGARWGELAVEASTPWIGELVRTAGDAVDRPGPARDRLLTDTACTLLRSPEPPRLVLMRLSQTEAVLRASGPWTPEARDAFARVDADLASLLRCIQASDRAGQVALMVAGDRAFAPVHSAVRPNRVLREAGLLAPPSPAARLVWRAVARSNGGSAFVYARNAEDAVAARDALRESAEASGAFRIVSAEEMITRQADPEAWFGLEAAPGYVLLDDASGPDLGPAPLRAVGGRLESTGPGLVAGGRGLRGGLRVPQMTQLDVAPTLALLLDVPLPDATGRAFVGWLAPGS